MRVALVAMPWANFDLPSPALGTLTAVIRQQEPGWTVDCYHEYVEVWSRLGPIYETISREDKLGEWLYAAHLFAEKRPDLRLWFVDWAGRDADWLTEDSPEEAFERIQAATELHIDELARRLANRYDLVGFTTSYCQLFASIAVAQRLKKLDSRVRTALGGTVVSGRCGQSILRHFECIDFIVQGEGERRFMSLLRSLEPHLSSPWESRRDLAGPDNKEQVPPEEIEDLDALPIPDYDEYDELAKRHRILWRLPVEGSRGCWWDRRSRTRNPMHSCHFCSLNSGTYRARSPERIAEEIRVQAERYHNVRFRFLDNILPPHGVERMAAAIVGLNKEIDFFCEARAHLEPRDLLSLWKAGLDTVQIGIEGLSRSYLERIGKGTTVIENLQAMKTCYELGIYCGANLLIEFPGASQQEVDETAETIRRFAVAYQPASIVRFQLYPSSAVCLVPERFGVSNVHNAEDFLVVLPRRLWEQLDLYWLDYEEQGERADWSSVRESVQQWWDLHRKLTWQDGTEWFLGDKPLSYADGGTFLEIMDRRQDLSLVTLEEPWRDLYLFCSRIRHRSAIQRHLSERVRADELEQVLQALVSSALVFREGDLYLSLAVASRPESAARRIEGSANGTDEQSVQGGGDRRPPR